MVLFSVALPLYFIFIHLEYSGTSTYEYLYMQIF